MPRQRNEELQKFWEGRIQKAKKRRADWAKEMRVELGRAYFEGKQNPGFPDAEWITINKLYSHLQAQLPTLYSLDPYFYMKLKRSFNPNPMSVVLMEDKAGRRQDMLNYLKGELELKPKVKLSILDAHFAYGVLKNRYSADLMKNPRRGESIAGEDGNPLLSEDGQPLTEPDEIPVNERYATNRIHPDDFLWDEDAGPLPDSWHWLGERVRMTRSQAKGVRQLNKRVVESLDAQPSEDEQRAQTDESGFLPKFRTFFRTPLKPKASPLPREEHDIIEWWEIYDLDAKKWLMIAPGADIPLMMPDDLPDGVEDHPYSILRFWPLRDKSPYPITLVSQAIDPQKEFCMARSRFMTHRKRFNRKYVMFDTAFGDLADEAAAKLEVGDDGTVLRALGVSATSAPVVPVQDAALDQQGWIEIQHLSGDLTEIMGSPGEALGLATADSATQAGLLDRRLEIREGDKLSDVVDFVGVWARKMDQLVQAHISRDEFVRITGPQGELWQAIRTTDFEDIEGEFEYGIHVGSMRPRLPDIERSQLIAFFSQVVIPFPHILTKPRTMKKMAELFHIEDDVMIEELRQLGLALMQGQLPMPGQRGSQPGQPESRPNSAALGSALGFTGGNVGAGGNRGIA